LFGLHLAGRHAMLTRMDPNYQQGGYDPNMQQMQMKRTNGMGIAALVVGIIGIFFLQIILGPLAIIFGAVGMGFANKNNGSGKGLAIAGLILGCVDLLLFFIVMAMFASASHGRF
jgi:uncharacterized protein DUF4190